MKPTRTLLVSSLCTSLLIATQTRAQNAPNWLPPTPSGTGYDAALDFTKNPILTGLTGHPRQVWVANACKMPSDPAGTWTVSLTVRALRGFGNPGFSGMLIAKWTPGAATPLVLTHEADAVNEAFIDYNLVLEPITKDANGNAVGGRYGTFDRFAFDSNNNLQFLGARLASRPNDTSPFGVSKPIQGLTDLTGFADPVTAHVGGKLKLMYVARHNNVDGIYMDDLLTPDTNPRVAGNPQLVVGADVAGVTPHAPIPFNGADGETKGLFLGEGDQVAATQSDVYFAADLDPATPAVRVHGVSGRWHHGGGAAGGTMIYIDNVVHSAPESIESAFLAGDTVGIGETAEVNIAAYSKPGTAAFAAVFAHTNWLPNPVTLPGTLGQLGIAPALKLGSGPLSADQTAAFRVQVPRIAALRGLDLNIQGVADFIDSNGNPRRALTNTAQVRVR